MIGFVITRFQIFTQSQAAQNDHYIGYDHRTAKFATINVQTDQKYSFL